MGLREYTIRRIGQLVVTYWAFITILFVLFRVMPGNPVTMFVAQGLGPEAQQEIIKNLGLNKPLYLQYIDFFDQLLHGSFGRSFIYRQPVWEIITRKFWNTIFLMVGGMFFAYTIGVLGGALLAWWRGTTFEASGIVFTLITRSSPPFWTSIVLIIVFVFWLGWFPAAGMRTTGTVVTGFWDKYFALDFAYHAFLPMVAIALYFVATPTLVMRNTMLEKLNAEFINLKQAEGLSQITVLYKHAARNSILPVLTEIAPDSGKALGGLLLVEIVFNWPGMGRAMVEAVRYSDYPLAIAAFFLMGSVVIFLNFVADILYAVLDPRVSYE
jgi:peptide/nickel transport system permease protein